MNVTWCATAPDTGRYSGVFTESSDEQLRTRLLELEARGAGYVEVAPAGREWPLLLLGFAGEHAVLHRQYDEASIDLLGGDGSVPMDEVVEVPVMDDEDPGSFTGEFVSSTERALGIVEQFLEGVDLEELGDWYAL